jgi:predicted transglutaminase-like cysteine proteinase
MAGHFGITICYRGSAMARLAFRGAPRFIVACLLFGIAAGADARPLPDPHFSVPIEEISPALAPFQHVRFCLRYPDDCKSDPSDAVEIELTAAATDTLNQVNRDVNAAIIPIQKNENFDINDRWTIAPAEGDCNDYAVTKRHNLLQNGFPARALRLAVVQTNLGIGHLVLVVATTRGNLVLDNLVESIRPWQSTKYRWLKIQSANDARYWYEVRSPTFALSQVERKLRVADR